MESKICPQCVKVFYRSATYYQTPSKWAKRKFCCMSCKSHYYNKDLVIRNKSRRKYPHTPGVSRSTIAYRNNPKYREQSRKRDSDKRETVINFLGNSCSVCGYDKDIRVLELDHINGDGYKDRLRLGAKVARYYSTHLEEAQLNLCVLCSNCNKIKAIENNEHNRSRRLEI